MQKNQEGKWHCPVTCKVFTDNSHIVAIKSTGSVFSYDAVYELNIKPKNYCDLLTNEPFSKADIITLLDPQNDIHVRKRDINNFIHIKQIRDEHKIQTSSSSSSSTSSSINDQKIRKNNISESVMKEIEIRKITDSETRLKKRALECQSTIDEYTDDVKDLLALNALISDVNLGQANTTGGASSSFTSTTMPGELTSGIRKATAEELREARYRKMREVGECSDCI